MIFNMVAGGGGVYELPALNATYPKDVLLTASESDSAILTVVFDAPGKPAEYTYQWYVDGEAVAGATSASYKMTGLTEAATHQVYCAITNKAGTVYTRIATVTVQSSMPAYTYTGTHQMINDGNGNWRIKFLTSGTLRFQNLVAASAGIDVFCVGGGGGGGTGGGGGGYTATSEAPISLQTDTDYSIVIGSGGASGKLNVDGGTGGTSAAFGVQAGGGTGSGGETRDKGGNGGSGGGSYNCGAGGSDGSDGAKGLSAGGTGQGTTTREFGEANGTLYAGGGGAAGVPFGIGGDGGGGNGANSDDYTTDDGKPGADNTGGGGGGYAWTVLTAGAGGSGIVVIRNHR